MGRTRYSYGGTEPYKKSSSCSGRRKKTKGQAETKMGRCCDGKWCDGRCQEVGERNWRNAANGHLAEASEEGLGSKGAVVPMMMMMMMMMIRTSRFGTLQQNCLRRVRKLTTFSSSALC
jgi:hypothetical protein